MMKLTSTLILILLAGPGLQAQTLPSCSDKPTWVTNPPIDPAYYVGIGVARKGQAEQNAYDLARFEAKRQLAQEISVNVSSTFRRTVEEITGQHDLQATDAFESAIEAHTVADLEDFDIIDSWECTYELWVYYRLSKEEFETRRKQKIQHALQIALDLYEKAQSNLDDGFITAALQHYVQALATLEPYADQPLTIEYQGVSIGLLPEVVSNLRILLEQISIKPEQPEYPAKIGRPATLNLSVFYTGFATPRPIANLPLLCSMIRGAADLLGSTKTTRSGKSACRIAKIKALDQLQLLEATIDLQQLATLTHTSGILEPVMNSLSIPTARITLNVTGPTFYVDSEEQFNGRYIDVPYVATAITEDLANRGFSPVRNKHEADYLVSIRALSRRGDTNILGTGLNSSYVDCTIYMTDLLSGDDVFTWAANTIKGVSSNFEKATHIAYQETVDLVQQEAVPLLFEHLQR